jgi:hypothetical protein
MGQPWTFSAPGAGALRGCCGAVAVFPGLAPVQHLFQRAIADAHGLQTVVVAKA